MLPFFESCVRDADLAWLLVSLSLSLFQCDDFWASSQEVFPTIQHHYFLLNFSSVYFFTRQCVHTNCLIKVIKSPSITSKKEGVMRRKHVNTIHDDVRSRFVFRAESETLHSDDGLHFPRFNDFPFSSGISLLARIVFLARLSRSWNGNSHCTAISLEEQSSDRSALKLKRLHGIWNFIFLRRHLSLRTSWLGWWWRRELCVFWNVVAHLWACKQEKTWY